jgi:uncharacterized membrane protein YeaQ/YmgE (transglycosylase-associated protein family)
MHFLCWCLIGVVIGSVTSWNWKKSGYSKFTHVVVSVAGSVGGGCFVWFVLKPYTSEDRFALYVLVDNRFWPSMLFAALGAIAMAWLHRRLKMRRFGN